MAKENRFDRYADRVPFVRHSGLRAIRCFRRTTVASMSGRFEIGVRCPVVSARGGAAGSGPSVVGQDESSDLCRNIGLGNGRRRFPAVPLAVGRLSPFFVRFRVPSVREGRIAFRHSRGALVSVRIPCPHSLCPGASEETKKSGSAIRNRSFSVAYMLIIRSSSRACRPLRRTGWPAACCRASCTMCPTGLRCRRTYGRFRGG